MSFTAVIGLVRPLARFQEKEWWMVEYSSRVLFRTVYQHCTTVVETISCDIVTSSHTSLTPHSAKTII